MFPRKSEDVDKSTMEKPDNLVRDLNKKMDLVQTVFQACLQETDDEYKGCHSGDEFVINRMIYLTKLSRPLISNMMGQKSIKLLPETNIKERQLETTENSQFECKLRQILYDNYVVSNIIPTMNILETELAELTTPDRLECDIKKSGYIWKRLDRTNRAIIIEDPKRTIQRLNYLKQMKRYRDQKHHIVYIEEKITEKDLDGVKTFKEHVVDADNAVIEFIAVSTKLGCLYAEKYTKFNVREYNKFITKFFYTRVFPKVIKIKPTVIVLEDKVYHARSFTMPTVHSSKANMVRWLKENRIPFSLDFHRAELFQLIERTRNKDIEVVEFDTRLSTLGYSVLRRPMRCSYLNIYQPIWENLLETLKEPFPAHGKTINELEALSFINSKNINIDDWRLLEKTLVSKEAIIYSEDVKLEHVIDKILTMAKYGNVSPWADECDEMYDSEQLAQIYVNEE